MTINEINIPIRDPVAQHNEDDSSGRVFAMSGHLDVRPEYQREFVYDEIYFVRRPDDTHEVLDGQQRILSICRYITNSAIFGPHPGGHRRLQHGKLQ